MFSSSEALVRSNLPLFGIVLQLSLVRTFSLLFAVSAVLSAQVPGVVPEVERAQAEVRRLEVLVEAGAAPRVALEKAKTALEEAQDHGVLRETLYGQIAVEELTEQQADEMVAAAQRNLSRKQQQLDEQKKLVDAGVLARTGLTPYLLELDDSRRVYDLAQSRGRLFRDLVEMARSEEELSAELDEAPQGPLPMMERFDGDGVFRDAHLRVAVLEFEKEFGKPLPISARGET